MKSVGLMAMAAGLLVCGGCATAGPGGDRWFAADKAQHFLAAGLISAATTGVAANNGASDETALAIAVPVTLSVGAGKELYDRDVKKTDWSWKDMTWNLIGALAGSLVVLQAR